MSIRIRRVGDHLVALCAARSMPQEGDLYLDDAVHASLTNKFAEDFSSEGFGDVPYDKEDAKLRAIEESNNPNRDGWNRRFGSNLGS